MLDLPVQEDKISEVIDRAGSGGLLRGLSRLEMGRLSDKAQGSQEDRTGDWVPARTSEAGPSHSSQQHDSLAYRGANEEGAGPGGAQMAPSGPSGPSSYRNPLNGSPPVNRRVPWEGLRPPSGQEPTASHAAVLALNRLCHTVSPTKDTVGRDGLQSPQGRQDAPDASSCTPGPDEAPKQLHRPLNGTPPPDGGVNFAMRRVQQLTDEMMIVSEDEKLVLGRAIGRGAFGTVFHGRWRNLDVAVKVGWILRLLLHLHIL